MGALGAAVPRNVTLFQATDKNTVHTGSFIHSQRTFCKKMTPQIKRALTL